jgi:hypothetical protein
MAVAFLASALAASDSWARGHGGGGGHHSGKSAGRSHHHGAGATFFVGAEYFLPAPYYYGPDYAERWTPPAAYVEKFEGTPTPETQDWIFCPSRGASYPDVTDCPGGWERVIPTERGY